jgi:aryl-alcohol dehydrogenase-like predicted oxidoreductase
VRQVEQRYLGLTGLALSRLALGTWSWGEETEFDEARAIMRVFIDAGGTLIDTADVYAATRSETMLGEVLRDYRRDDVIIATKAVGTGDSPTRHHDASRRHLLSALDASLKRLCLDHVDLWQMHAWDSTTPLSETLSTLDLALQSGRTRYVGISNYTGWQTAKAATWQRAWPGRATLASTQVEYSLLARSVEAEVLPAAADAGLGVLAWSPLGRGVLTGKYRTGVPADSRGASHRAGFVEAYFNDRCERIVEAVVAAAGELAASPSAVALAWVRDQPGVTAPILGARTVAQLEDSLTSDVLTLPDEIRSRLTHASR